MTCTCGNLGTSGRCELHPIRSLPVTLVVNDSGSLLQRLKELEAKLTFSQGECLRWRKDFDKQAERITEIERKLDDASKAAAFWEAETKRAERFSEDVSAKQHEAFMILYAENARLRESLELVAAPKRSDGTYNRCREACEQLAKEALARQDTPGKLAPSDSPGTGSGEGLGSPSLNVVHPGPICSVPGHIWSYEGGCPSCARAAQDSRPLCGHDDSSWCTEKCRFGPKPAEPGDSET